MHKVDEMQAVYQNNSVDIACITETRLRDDVPTEVVNISGYVIHRGDRGGGVAVFVRQDPKPAQKSQDRLTAIETTNIECVWLLYRRPRMPRQLSHVAV